MTADKGTTRTGNGLRRAPSGATWRHAAATILIASAAGGTLSGCTGDHAANGSRSTAEKSSGPTMQFNGDGSGTFQVHESSRSTYAEAVGTSAGELLELRTPRGGATILVAAERGAVEKKTAGWKVRTISNDAMFDPDRCTTVAPVVAGSSLAFFETIVRPDGDPSAAANPRWYQLQVTDGKTFRRLTPSVSLDEAAYPQTLQSLGGDLVGYLWQSSAAVAGGARAKLEASSPGASVGVVGSTDGAAAAMGIGGAAVAVPAGAGSVLAPQSDALMTGGAALGRPDEPQRLGLHWRTVDLSSLTFRDVDVELPRGASLRSAYALDGRTVLHTNDLTPLAFDPAALRVTDAKSDRMVRPEPVDLSALQGSTALTKAELAVIDSSVLAGRHDVRVVNRTKKSTVVEVALERNGHLVREAAELDLAAKELVFAPLRKGARSCLLRTRS